MWFNGCRFMGHIYSMPAMSDITGHRRPFDDDNEQEWFVSILNEKRHDGLYKSKFEKDEEERKADEETF